MTWQADESPAGIADSKSAEDLTACWLRDPELLITGANTAYDLAVLCNHSSRLVPLVFAALDEDRVTDVQIRQKLIDIARGCYRGKQIGKGKRIPLEYSLKALAKRCAGIELEKDAWRLSYGEFVGVELAAWPVRAAQVQEKARATLQHLRDAWAHVRTSDVPKAVSDQIDGLASMVASDASRCTTYPLDDATATLAVHKAQEAHADYLHDQFRQTRADVWLHLSSAWGLHTDEEGVRRLATEVQAQCDAIEEQLIELGLVRPNKTRNTKLAKLWMVEVCRESGMDIPRTDSHPDPENVEPGTPSKCKDRDGNTLPAGHDDCVEHVSLSAESCELSEDPTLESYAELDSLGRVLNTTLKTLADGAVYPLHTRYNIAETGRTTSSNPPIQNLSKRGGIRECFIPRAGNVFWQADFPTLELYALAQCCMTWLGRSKLAEALNAGMDPHLWVAAIILRTTYQDAEKSKKTPEVQKARQLAKPANFGFPGGMGIKKFVAATRKQVLADPDQGRKAWEAMELDEARAKKLRDEWLQAWPEMDAYFARIARLCDNPARRATVESLWTKRVRGGASYCAASNSGFQGLGADCAKEAGWRIAKAEYVGTPSQFLSSQGVKVSPLFGARTVAFVHDEFIGECPDNERAHDVAVEAARLMVEGANIYLPDVPIPFEKMEPTLMRRWSKKAKQVFGSDGRLVPWT